MEYEDTYVSQWYEMSKEDGFVFDFEKGVDYLLDNDRTIIERESYIQSMRSCMAVEIMMREL
jgi:hypothetical protein|tara:strand:+ start:318 stop:503 length:186 start_codon:yes stop_codon:yes gene_type:complete